jgi:multidrug efflux pump subunit AcrB
MYYIIGVLQFAGFHINAISYVAMVMSIGLLVDFIMHVLLRYFQVPGSRQEKTREMLRTMGSSVFVGGLSTFLGVIPLAFSTSGIFKTTFTIFIGMVTLGIGHGLILFPVVLSLVGPTDHVEGVRLIHTILEKENIEEEEEEGAAVIVDKLSTQNELEEADVMNKDVSRLEMVRENETDDDVMHA